MSDDGYKIQASVKYANGDGMVNVRGNDKEEFLDNLAAATDSAASLALLSEALREEFPAVQAFANAFPGTTVQPQQGVQTCKHGPRVHKSGPDWEGWFCKLPKTDNDRCKPVYPGR